MLASSNYSHSNRLLTLSSIWFYSRMGHLRVLVATCFDSVCFEHGHSRNRSCAYRYSYFTEITLLMLLSVFKHSCIDSYLSSRAIRAFGWMLDYNDFWRIPLVGEHCWNGTITDIMFSCWYSRTVDTYATNKRKLVLVGVITRAISMISDATVLGITVWKTFYLFRMDTEVRENKNLTATLVYNGKSHFCWYSVVSKGLQ